jgi:peptidoglycan-N-acetylglucosamine deacetylase
MIPILPVHSIDRTKLVPVLITWDVDPDLWVPLDARCSAMDVSMNMCHSLGIRATYFITAMAADTYPNQLENLQLQGHEIGCHGFTHGDEEDYNRMPEAMQRSYIEAATRKLHGATGAAIHAFRSPRVKTSALTLHLLSEYAYRADSSVCSQRVDFVSSNLINLGWIRSPRRPYHPHRDDAFRRGDAQIWEIPISALIVPFISSALRALGLRAMKGLFRMLYAESRRTGKPIVYLAHPTEFVAHSKRATVRDQLTRYLRPSYLSPAFIRTHGFRPRSLLYQMDSVTLCESTRELFLYMLSFPGVRFMTISESTAYLESRAC